MMKKGEEEGKEVTKKGPEGKAISRSAGRRKEKWEAGGNHLPNCPTGL